MQGIYSTLRIKISSYCHFDPREKSCYSLSRNIQISRYSRGDNKLQFKGANTQKAKDKGFNILEIKVFSETSTFLHCVIANGRESILSQRKRGRKSGPWRGSRHLITKGHPPWLPGGESAGRYQHGHRNSINCCTWQPSSYNQSVVIQSVMG